MSTTRLMWAKGVSYTSGNDLTPTHGGTTVTLPGFGDGAIRITVALDTATTMILRFNGVNHTLNSGNNLVAEGLHTFSLELEPGESFSVRFGASCTVRLLKISYVPGEVL